MCIVYLLDRVSLILCNVHAFSLPIRIIHYRLTSLYCVVSSEPYSWSYFEFVLMLSLKLVLFARDLINLWEHSGQHFIILFTVNIRAKM